MHDRLIIWQCKVALLEELLLWKSIYLECSTLPRIGHITWLSAEEVVSLRFDGSIIKNLDINQFDYSNINLD